MMINALTNAGKHVISNVTGVRNQRYSNDDIVHNDISHITQFSIFFLTIF